MVVAVAVAVAVVVVVVVVIKVHVHFPHVWHLLRQMYLLGHFGSRA